MVDHATLNSNDSLSKRIAILHVAIRVAIVGIATLIWFAVPLVLQGPPKRPPAFVVFIVAYIVFLCVNCVIFDCFAVGQARVRDLSVWLCLALFFTDIIVWALFHLASQHVTEFYIILLVWVVQSIIGMLAVMLLTQLYFNVYPKRHICAVIAGTDYEKRTLAKMSGVSNRFIVEEIIDQKRVNPDAVGKLAPQCNTIFIGEIDSRLRQAIVDDCFQKSRMTVVLPTITNVLFTGYKPTQVSDTLLFSQGNMGISPEQKFFKRIVDIIGSIIGIIICAIPIAICAIIIKVTDGGDVFYRQDRLTRNGKVFEMIKLRSMSMDAEKNGVRTATKGDERVASRIIDATARRSSFGPVVALVFPPKITEISAVFSQVKLSISNLRNLLKNSFQNLLSHTSEFTNFFAECKTFQFMGGPLPCHSLVAGAVN